MCKCKKCKEDVNLLDTYVYFGPCWIRWVCQKCNYELNYKRTNCLFKKVEKEKEKGKT